jgi:hypothetical protein
VRIYTKQNHATSTTCKFENKRRESCPPALRPGVRPVPHHSSRSRGFSNFFFLRKGFFELGRVDVCTVFGMWRPVPFLSRPTTSTLLHDRSTLLQSTVKWRPFRLPWAVPLGLRVGPQTRGNTHCLSHHRDVNLRVDVNLRCLVTLAFEFWSLVYKQQKHLNMCF